MDTGAQISVLTVKAAQTAGIFHMLDRRYAGEAQGVGSCRVLGRLPAGSVLLVLNHEHTVKAPAIAVLESTAHNEGVELLLGLDFLRDYQAVLDLRKDEMWLRVPQEIRIPFLRKTAEDFDKENNSADGEDDFFFGDKYAASFQRRNPDEYHPDHHHPDDFLPSEYPINDGSIDMSGV